MKELPNIEIFFDNSRPVVIEISAYKQTKKNP